jgi:hypothetical protein
MLIHRLLLALALLLVPAAAGADGHRAGGYGGGGFQKSKATGLLHFGFDFVPPHEAFNRLPIAVDFSLPLGDDDDDDVVKTFAAGVLLPAVRLGHDDHLLSGRLLIGRSLGQGAAGIVGVSYEYVNNRLQPGVQHGFRVQADGIFVDEAPAHFRLTAGYVIRYKASK